MGVGLIINKFFSAILLLFICVCMNYVLFLQVKGLPVQAQESSANSEMPVVYFLGKKYLLRYANTIRNDVSINGFLNILTINKKSSRNSNDFIELFQVDDNFDEYYNIEYEKSILFSLGINNNMEKYYFNDFGLSQQKFILTNKKEHGVYIISYLTPSDDGSYTEYNVYKYICSNGFYGIKYSRKYYRNNDFKSQKLRSELYSIVKDDIYYTSIIKKLPIPQMYNEKYGSL